MQLKCQLLFTVETKSSTFCVKTIAVNKVKLNLTV